jgi:ribosomal protein L11 methyltransferase
MTDEPVTWRIELDVPSRTHVDLIERALSMDDAPVSSTEITPGGRWRLEVYCDAEPDREELTARLNIVAASRGIATPEFVIEKMAAIDWVKRVQENSPPVTAGRFYIYGSHVTEPVPTGQIGIRIDAGAAFGTGTHETTQGCLIAFDQLSRRGEIRSALDLGCGSGILAIGIAKLWHASILATDNDPMAVDVTAENAGINGVADRIQAIHSEGFNETEIRDRGPFDLIAANILAQPLISMAPEIALHIAPGGDVVLSGLLDIQSDDVVSAYQRAGLTFAEIIVLGEWHTLIMHRP